MSLVPQLHALLAAHSLTLQRELTLRGSATLSMPTSARPTSPALNPTGTHQNIPLQALQGPDNFITHNHLRKSDPQERKPYPLPYSPSQLMESVSCLSWPEIGESPHPSPLPLPHTPMGFLHTISVWSKLPPLSSGLHPPSPRAW